MLRIALPLIAACVVCGCTTKRILEIHTNPPGAHVWVNGTHFEKRTPVEVPFTHYGFWDIRVEKKGYKAVAKEIQVKAGIDGYPIVDLFAETVVPEKRFRRTIELEKLEPATEADIAACLKRAQAFRKKTYEEAEQADAPERLLPGTDDLIP